MGTVTTLTFLFVAISLAIKWLHEKAVFLFKSNWKYKVLDTLAEYIYYGSNIGIKQSLSLDRPTSEVLGRRLQGQEYLASKLSISSETSSHRGEDLAARLADCRFALTKVLVPLLRELEFAPPRNFITELRYKDCGKSGIHKVVTENGQDLIYLGNDAVHTLGVESFYAPLQNEINSQMGLASKNDKSSLLRFAPISLNSELEKNAELVLRLTGMDQVRYCLSGSEAMDAAFKDVRASCRGKKYIVRFQSAYHGHVSGVDFLNAPNQIYLRECDPASLKFIEDYHYRIAAVVVNPMQHFTGINKPSPPGEKLTMTKRVRVAISKKEYAQWLHNLAEKCHYCTKFLTKVAFIVDDIYFAFRTPELFSFRYFSHPETGAPLRPDVLVLGKGVAAGYPLSMVLGRGGYLNTYDKKWLLQVNKTVGTLAAWHGGIVASTLFLEVITGISSTVSLPIDATDQLKDLVAKCDSFTTKLNKELKSENLPVRIRNFSNTFSVDYLVDSLYNSRYPQYLMAEGIFLGNYSTGKFNINADATEADLELVAAKFVAAVKRMRDHGYFEPNQRKLALLASLAVRFFVNFVRLYYNMMMEDKHIDIQVSHNHPVNKFGHFWSSVFMLLFAYPWCLMGRPIEGCLAFFVTHVVRQSGHFFYEHQDRDIEKLKFGHKDGSKKAAVVFLVAAGLIYRYQEDLWAFSSQHLEFRLGLEQYISFVALFTVVPHFVDITHQYGYLRGLEWMIKILTDPITDLIDFYEYCIIHPKWFLAWKDQSAVYKLNPTTKKIIKIN